VEIVSHGIDLENGKLVILPCETPASFGATKRNGKWVIPKGG
jgi:hypothetical protein